MDWQPRVSERKRKIIRVRGLVQGVNYRQAARREAERLGIAGFARNEADGSVTVEAEGNAEDVDLLVERCRHGPAAAQVSHVEVSEGPPVGYDGFARR
jgi:acylphosphatase